MITAKLIGKEKLNNQTVLYFQDRFANVEKIKISTNKAKYVEFGRHYKINPSFDTIEL